MEAGMSFETLENVVEQDWDSYVFEEGKIESKLREYFTSKSAPINEIRELR